MINTHFHLLSGTYRPWSNNSDQHPTPLFLIWRLWFSSFSRCKESSNPLKDLYLSICVCVCASPFSFLSLKISTDPLVSTAFFTAWSQTLPDSVAPGYVSCVFGGSVFLRVGIGTAGILRNLPALPAPYRLPAGIGWIISKQLCFPLRNEFCGMKAGGLAAVLLAHQLLMHPNGLHYEVNGFLLCFFFCFLSLLSKENKPRWNQKHTDGDVGAEKRECISKCLLKFCER